MIRNKPLRPKFHAGCRLKPFILGLFLPASALAAATAPPPVVLGHHDTGRGDTLEEAGWSKATGTDRLTIPNSSLVVDNLQGRQHHGGQWKFGRHRISGFGLAEEATKHEPEDDSEKNAPQGILWSASPSTLAPDRLTVTGTYVHNPEDGDLPDSGQATGSAGAIALDSKLPAHGEVHLHGEVAYSHFDPDGINESYDARDDWAYAGSVSYRPQLGGKTRLQLHAGFQEIGPEFKSVANPGLLADQQQTSAGFQLERDRFSVRTGVSRTLNNIRGDSSRPTLKTDSVHIHAEYHGSSRRDHENHLFLFQEPRFALGLSRSHAKDEALPEGLWPTDRVSSQINLSMAFSPGPAHWSVEQSIGSEEDLTNTYLDQISRTTQLNVSLPLNGWTHFSTSLQETNREYENGHAEQSQTAGLHLGLHGKGGWRASMSLNETEQQNSEGGLGEQYRSVDFRVDKNVPKSMLPGNARFWFGGGYKDSDAPYSGNASEFQVYGGIKLDLGSG